MRVHKHSKLTPKYFGTFLVLERIGKVAYRLDLPDEAQIDPVFHVSLLKPAPGPPEKILPVPVDSRFRLRPEEVIEKKMVKRGNRVVIKVLVRWNNQTANEATWEYLDDMKLRFPDFAEFTF
ncbi:uncharacterized protein LOC143637251 [Bidens hawaiensis]|uniref:uncharacterized protein LOC143637251 n=1 Tax=Bidens hawaiensis TaxID=980011 RepID=UPI004049D9B6